jgi:pre-rRNA-processing protein SRD1
MPIVYCSEPFEALTGYSAAEVLGRNCRFLQGPDGQVCRGARRTHTDDATIFELKNRISAGEEAQTAILNYKKGGIPFVNVLTTIPIRWSDGAAEAQFVVGFQVDRRDCFV